MWLSRIRFDALMGDCSCLFLFSPPKQPPYGKGDDGEEEEEEQKEGINKKSGLMSL